MCISFSRFWFISCSSFWMILSQTLAIIKIVWWHVLCWPYHISYRGHPIISISSSTNQIEAASMLCSLMFMYFCRHSLPERQSMTHHLHGRIAHLFVVEVWCLGDGALCCAYSGLFSLYSHSLVQITQRQLLRCLKVNKSNISREDETVCIVVCGDIWCSSEWNKKHQQGNWGIIKLTIPKI